MARLNNHDSDHPYQPNTAEELIFNDNLREFSVRVGQICGLESNGKISQAEAYKRIRKLWQTLKRSKKGLGINSSNKETPD